MDEINPKIVSMHDVHLIDATTSQIGIDIVPHQDSTKLAVESSMPDAVSIGDTLSIQQILNTPVFLGTFNWSESQGFNTKLIEMFFPNYLFTQMDNAFTTALLQNYAYIRGNMKLQIRCNSTRFHQGCLVTLFTPGPTRRHDVSNGGSISIATYDCNIHAYTYASEANTIEIHIPFQHPLNFLPLLKNLSDSTYGYMGLASTHVVVPLAAADGASSTVELSMFAWFEDVTLGVRMMKHALPQMLKAAKGVHSVVGDAIDAFENATQGNVSGAVDSATKAMDDIAIVADNLDKPASSDNSTLGRIQTVSPLLHGSGVDHNTRLGLISRAPHGVPRCYNSSLADMDLLKIAQKPGIIGIYNWPASAAAGNTLAVIPVHPYYIYSFKKGNDITSFSFIPLTAVASRYFRWKGSIRYTFKIVGTTFHRGRLIVSFHPFKEANFNSILHSTSVKNTVFEFSDGQSEFSWEVPFYSMEAWKDFSAGDGTPGNYNWMFHNFPSNNLAPAPTLREYERFSTGFLTINVVNPLIVTNNIPTSVSIIVKASGGPDINFSALSHGVPTPGEYYGQPAFSSFSVITDKEVLEAMPQMFQPDEPVLTTPTMKGSAYVAANKLLTTGEFGETHLKNVLRRKVIVNRRRHNASDGLAWSIQFVAKPLLSLFHWGAQIAMSPSQATATKFPLSHLTHFCLQYAFWSGSQRFTMITSNPAFRPLLTMSYLQPNNYLSLTDSILFGEEAPPFSYVDQTLGLDVQNGSLTPTLEYEIPFHSSTYCRYMFDGLAWNGQAASNRNYLQTSGTMGINFDPIEPSSGRQLETHLFYGAGDDFQVWWYVGTPMLDVSTAILNPSIFNI